MRHGPSNCTLCHLHAPCHGMSPSPPSPPHQNHHSHHIKPTSHFTTTISPTLLQLDELEARLSERKRRGESRVDKKSGQFLDKESRVLAHMILTTRRPVDMDEAEQQVARGG